MNMILFAAVFALIATSALVVCRLEFQVVIKITQWVSGQQGRRVPAVLFMAFFCLSLLALLVIERMR